MTGSNAASKPATRTTRSGRARATEGRRAKEQSDASRGTTTSGGKGETRKRGGQAGSGER
jgi:hypothetical protein